MKQTIEYIFLFSISYFILGCFGQSTSNKKKIDYIKSKSEFDTMFTRHFPISIETERALTVSKTSPENNIVGYYLYEFGVNVRTLDSLTKMAKSKSIIRYNWKDSCLLIVHPNETIDDFEKEDTLERGSVDTIYEDSTDCLKNKLPIPNFIDLQSPNSKFGISMDSTFNIFVLEAKVGKFSRYDLAPLKSMPRNWENGFSRGVTISLDKAVVVYWMIIW